MKQETKQRYGQAAELQRSETQNYTMFPTQHPQQAAQKFYELSSVQSIWDSYHIKYIYIFIDGCMYT